MKIAIIGADGQLGYDLCRVIDQNEQIPLTLKDVDITDPVKCDQILSKYSPEVVINTAAYHRVDDCEEADLEAYRVNAHGVKNVALACRNIKAIMVNFSTDYVFDGEKKSPYNENDIPNPKTAYGISKLAGESFIKYILDRYFVIRTSGLYGRAGCLGKGGSNFVEKMLQKARAGQKIKVVNDEILSPTYTLDLAQKINELVRTKHYGLYHITNNGQCSWWEFAVKIFELAGLRIEVEKVSSDSYQTKAHRPQFSVLDNQGLRKTGLGEMRQWDEALQAYLKEKRKK